MLAKHFKLHGASQGVAIKLVLNYVIIQVILVNDQVGVVT